MFAADVPSVPRSATFQVRHELKISVPDKAGKVQIRFAMPQDDPAQDIHDFTVQAPAAHRITTDSEGNKSVYVEMDRPVAREVSVVESFIIVRREQLSGVDAKKTRPLTDEDRSRLSHFLAANQYVVIDEQIRKLASQIVGNEKNPALAARKLYDWVLGNIDYWVKDPKNKKASPVGSTE